MVTLDPAGGFAADLAAAVCVLGCTAAGLPVSTTHAKTCAMMGAGRRADRSVVRELALAWGPDLPGLRGIGMAVCGGDDDWLMWPPWTIYLRREYF